MVSQGGEYDRGRGDCLAPWGGGLIASPQEDHSFCSNWAFILHWSSAQTQARQRLLCVLKLADSVPSPRDEESELSCKLTEGPSPQFLYNLHCTCGKVLLHFCQGDGLLGEPDGGGLLRCSQFAFGDLLSFACLVWALKAQAQAFPLPKSFP